MLLPPIHINLVILVIIILEIAIFVNQLLSYMARPYEKNRLYHVILTGLLILYNVCENLFILPDPYIPLPLMIQNIVSDSAGYFVTMYIPFYCYKTLGLERLSFHGKYGYLFILGPTVFMYFIHYPIYNDFAFTSKYSYYAPAMYAIVALIAAYRAIYLKYKENGDRAGFRERLWIFAAVVIWCISPAIDDLWSTPKWVISALFNNINFILMSGFFMRQTIKRFLKEYDLLQRSNTTLSEKVRERTIQLERSNEQRTNTLVNLVHETKTPLTLINNYLEEYIHKYGYKKELEIVKNNLDKLNRDISNLFDLERYNKGFVIYNHNQVANFSKILADNLVLFKVYCRKKQVTLHENIEQDVLIKADPGAINGIVNNIVENAIKYTDDGGEISILLQTSGARINFNVRDNGIGIPEELHEKVFEPYYQINSEKGGFQGMGLGMPIVKKTLTELDGRITIESNPAKGNGTLIAIELKKYAPEINGPAVSNYSVSNYSGLELGHIGISDSQYDEKKPTILLVEDNAAMLSYLFKKLTKKYNVTVAVNGSEALTRIRNYPALPDLIISDVMMDKVDGFKLAKILSEDADFKHIPIIFLTAKQTPADKSYGLRLGALDYIQKPFNTEELLLKMASMLEITFQQRRKLLDNALKALKSAGNLEFRQKEAAPQTGGRFEQNCKLYQLTAREIDISKLIGEGYSYKEIGETLFIAERTVKKHVQNIFEKVSITNKIQLINKLEA
ncbi:ATP-binding protein [Chitinophaga barathri]|uniref:histidine kinase n=1 Tax=Chitinophaga barathri TaxID=1647451 RepID=A0A3N4MAH0_9BACT|nr:ATP-binding protein [Chitinophaga barathri]RPD38387.1 response regulator [Chitinophaga barathri]